MLKQALPLCVCAFVGLAACNQGGGDNAAGSGQSSAAAEAAGEKTIGAGINQNSRFYQAAKSVGLDATLTGPGPYTVFVPDDQALSAVQTGDAAQPQARAQLTGILTNHILPGTILAEDIGKAIDNGNGKAALVTMGGGTLTATREGDKVVLTDGAGAKATVSKADEQYSNGVVHHINAVLKPQQAAGQTGGAQPAGAAAPAAQPQGG